MRTEISKFLYSLQPYLFICSSDKEVDEFNDDKIKIIGNPVYDNDKKEEINEDVEDMRVVFVIPPSPLAFPILKNLRYVLEDDLIANESNSGSIFGGHPSLQERTESFNIKESMRVHCGFDKAKKPSQGVDMPRERNLVKWRKNYAFAISQHYQRFDVFEEAEANRAVGKNSGLEICPGILRSAQELRSGDVPRNSNLEICPGILEFESGDVPRNSDLEMYPGILSWRSAQEFWSRDLPRNSDLEMNSDLEICPGILVWRSAQEFWPKDLPRNSNLAGITCDSTEDGLMDLV
ncbi:hypothetical protein ZIOFF_029877 [Zingiber officinale]|uniref:TOD1/MUCI70 glycosyltransferase-like domain-containing protein n=1 Tax=Zingiber officinale TaxID=94328 RepID=A0A8J5H8N4_ZINOF|nr:hypothetical protein ZIOFF_029877 [Zingiber officinale]